MRVLGIIPARKGSKGIPGKNTRLLCGQSLIERASTVAQESRVLDRVILSTDDPSAVKIAAACGLEVPFLRPEHLATDDSPMMSVVVHALELEVEKGYRPDAVMILQPTSPLRTPEHLRAAVEMLTHYTSVCSVTPLPPTHNPYYVMRMRDDGCLDDFLGDGVRVTRRQDVPPAYVRDGTVYLVRTATVLADHSLYGERCRPMVLRSGESISIDDESDWEEAERRLRLGAV